jgi:hypothetical protein
LNARLCEFYERVKRRRGEQKALVAVACKMLKFIWLMLTTGSPISLGIQGCMKKRFIGFQGISLTAGFGFQPRRKTPFMSVSCF